MKQFGTDERDTSRSHAGVRQFRSRQSLFAISSRTFPGLTPLTWEGMNHNGKAGTSLVGIGATSKEFPCRQNLFFFFHPLSGFQTLVAFMGTLPLYLVSSPATSTILDPRATRVCMFCLVGLFAYKTYLSRRENR